MDFNVINDIKCAVKIISTEFLFTSVFFPNMPSVMNIRFHFVTRCHELEDSSRTLTLVTKWFSMSRCLNSSRTYCHEVPSSRSYIPSDLKHMSSRIIQLDVTSVSDDERVNMSHQTLKNFTTEVTNFATRISGTAWFTSIGDILLLNRMWIYFDYSRFETYKANKKYL